MIKMHGNETSFKKTQRKVNQVYKKQNINEVRWQMKHDVEKDHES